jgi:hypothetical protein
MDSSNLSIAVGADTHLYQGIRVTNATDTIQIWEVNWSDLNLDYLWSIARVGA